MKLDASCIDWCVSYCSCRYHRWPSGLVDMVLVLEVSLWTRANSTGVQASIHYTMSLIHRTAGKIQHIIYLLTARLCSLTNFVFMHVLLLECAGDTICLKNWLLSLTFFVLALFHYATLEAGKVLKWIQICLSPMLIFCLFSACHLIMRGW